MVTAEISELLALTFKTFYVPLTSIFQVLSRDLNSCACLDSIPFWARHGAGSGAQFTRVAGPNTHRSLDTSRLQPS